MILFFSVQLASQQYGQMCQANEDHLAFGQPPVEPSYKMTIATAVLIALLFSILNMIVTLLGDAPGGDRQNYIIAFQGVRETSSAGVMFVINLLRQFTSNEHILFYVTTFLSMLITIWAYRISEDATPAALFFLLTTQYVFSTFSVIKQSYSNAFAAVCIALAFRNKGWRDALLSFVMIALAIWFHPTGYFLLVIYPLIRIRKTKGRVIILFLAMIILGIFFKPIILRVAAIAAPYAPKVSLKIYEYLGEGEMANEALQGSGPAIVLKGIPYFIITYLGWTRREKLLERINHYDDYLLLSGLISYIYIYSAYNSWIYRLAYFLYLPVACFFVQLLQHEEEKNQQILYLIVMGINAFYTLRFLALMFIRYGGF